MQYILTSIRVHIMFYFSKSSKAHLLTLFSSEKFAADQSDCNIIQAESENKKIGWKKRFEFTLIGWFDKNTGDNLVIRLLHYAEDILIMFMGEEDLETLDAASKRDLRLCYPILDSLLSTVDDIPSFVLLQFPVKAINPVSNLEAILDNWADEIETPYAAILDGNEILSVTPEFEESLAHEEINLLIQISALNKTAAVLEVLLLPH